MVRYYITILVLFFISLSGFSQHTLTNAKVIDDLVKYSPSRLGKKSSTNPASCGMDTVEYARYKASRLYFIGMKKDYSLGQFYSTPQEITVHGFSFYSFIYSTPPTTKTIRLICNIYKAGSDSLPSGSPLRSDTVTVDSTFGGGILSNVVKYAKFKTPLTLDYPYILTVESDSVNINASIVSNDWNSGDGKKKNFLCGSVSGKWYRGLNLNIGGKPLDADVLLNPHVSYKFGNDFTFKDCANMNDSVRFKNGYQKTVSGSPFYNMYNFYPYDWICHQWNYGDLPWDTYDVEGINQYSAPGNYTVRLVSRVFPWHGNGVCYDTTIKTVYFKPRNPMAIGSTNICKGDSANILVGSDNGTTIQWFKNPVDKKPVYEGELYRLGVPTKNDTFYLKAINFSCESGMSQIIISVNDYPKNPVIGNDSICNGARANLSAKSNVGVTEWFTDSAFKPFYFGDLFQTKALNDEISYFVRTNNNGCFSPSFQKVTAFVDNSFAPDDPIVSNDTNICLRPIGKAMLKAFNSSNDTIKWYANASGGNSISVGNNYEFTAASKGVFTIYVEASKTVCASSRLGINISVDDYPAISKVFNDERCKGDTSQPAILLASPGNVDWYLKATGGVPVQSGVVIRYYAAKTMNLYAEASSNGCINPSRSVVNLKINAYDSITKIQVPLVCGTATATLKVTAGTSTVKWYDDDQLKNLVSSNATFVTPKLPVSTNYYFTVEKNGCVSPVNTVRVDVLPLPIPGFKDSIVKGHKIKFTPYSNSGVKYKWHMGDGTTFTTKLVTYGYANYGTYTVKLIVTNLTSNCVDSLSRDVVFDFGGIRAVKEGVIKVFPNPASDKFTIRLPKDLNKGQLSIISTDGKTVYTSSLNDNKDVIIDEPLAKGIYFIKVEWDNKRGFSRLVVD